MKTQWMSDSPDVIGRIEQDEPLPDGLTPAQLFPALWATTLEPDLRAARKRVLKTLISKTATGPDTAVNVLFQDTMERVMAPQIEQEVADGREELRRLFEHCKLEHECKDGKHIYTIRNVRSQHE